MNRRVVHLIAGDINGGAAKGALILHKSLLASGVDSIVLSSSNKFKDEPGVIYLHEAWVNRFKGFVRKILDKSVGLIFGGKYKTPLSSGLFGINHRVFKRFITDQDIIHLHWINSGFVDLKFIAEFKNPIVWTLRDMWPFTGICHYSFDCRAYLSKCGGCPQIKLRSSYDLSRFIFKRKEKYIAASNLRFAVGISDWITSQAKLSPILNGVRCITIPNAIDSNVFVISKSRENAKAALGFDIKKKVIVVGATNLSSKYKGFSLFLESLKYLEPSKFQIVTFGIIDADALENLPFEFINLHTLNSTELMEVYNAGDVFVAPSMMDAFAKTVAEALACGTPVVCFDNSGPNEIVDHKFTGYKVKAFDVKELAYGVDYVTDKLGAEEFRSKFRESVIARFSPQVTVHQYRKIYEEISTE